MDLHIIKQGLMAWRGYLVCWAVIICLIKCAEGQENKECENVENGICYRYNSTAVTWYVAADSCHQQGFLLVTVPNEETQKALEKAMMNENATDVWIGGFNERNDTDAVLLWRWLDGAAVQYQGCFYEYYPVVDFDFYNPVSPSISNLVPALCIQACQNYKFAKLKNGDTCTCTNIVRRYRIQFCTDRCVGDASLTCGGGAYNSDVYLTDAPPIRWVDTMLNSYTNTCGSLIHDVLTNVTGFNPGRCEDMKRYLCDIADSSCKTNYLRVGAQCVYIGTPATTWYKARHECITKGGTLSMLKTDKQIDILTKLIISSGASTGDKIELWVGLAREYFLWLTKDSFKDKTGWEVLNTARTNNQITYNNLALNGTLADKNFCLRATKDYGYMWSEALCEEKRTYFCAYDQLTTTTAATTTTTTGTTTTAAAATTTAPVDATTADVNTSTTTAATAAPTTTTTEATTTTPAPTVTTGGTTITTDSGGSTQIGGLNVGIIVVIVLIIILIIIGIIVIILCVLNKKNRRPISPEENEEYVVRGNGAPENGNPPTPSTFTPPIRNSLKVNGTHSDTNGNIIIDASTIHDQGLGPYTNRLNGTSSLPLAIPETDRSERRRKKKKKNRRQDYETNSARTTTVVYGSPRRAGEPLPSTSLDPRRIRGNPSPMNRPRDEPFDNSSGDGYNSRDRIYIP